MISTAFHPTLVDGTEQSTHIISSGYSLMSLAKDKQQWCCGLGRGLLEGLRDNPVELRLAPTGHEDAL